MSFLDTVYRPEENVVTRDVAGETLLVPISGELADLQHMFWLNEVGSFIWERLDGTQNLRTILAQLIEAFEVAEERAQEDLTALIDELARARLIQGVGS